MPTLYPLVLDTSPSATFPSAATLATHDLADDTHGNLHDEAGKAIVGLETRVGVVSSTDVASLDYASREPETAYTPVMTVAGGTLTCPATLTGSYFRASNAKIGRISLSIVATGTWAILTGASPYIEVSMPSGWTGAASRECANGYGLGYPVPSLGNHALLFPVLHPGATLIRFVSRIASGDDWDYAINGVTSPFAATADDIVFDGFFDVRLA